MTAMLPKGFLLNGIHCGIAKKKSKRDLSLFVSDRGATAAGMFTRNRVTAAPVVLCREQIGRASCRERVS
jgi:glutamate N-acetyltransferase/amino-acid N-acetyltransferase